MAYLETAKDRYGNLIKVGSIVIATGHKYPGKVVEIAT